MYPEQMIELIGSIELPVVELSCADCHIQYSLSRSLGVILNTLDKIYVHTYSTYIGIPENTTHSSFQFDRRRAHLDDSDDDY